VTGVSRTRLFKLWNLHFGIAAGCGGVDGCEYFLGVEPDPWPVRGAQHNQGNETATEVLPIADALVGGQKDIEASLFGGREQFTVRELIPPGILRLGDRVVLL
jgi:hypothetical protein